jgi:hypothetical protein
MTGYELAYRTWRGGSLREGEFRVRAARFRTVVRESLARVRRQRVTGGTADAKRILSTGLEARRRALDALLAGDEVRYRKGWDRSLVAARRALAELQDLRDAARLIPLPEDSIS